jgi:hypothetical protein
MRWCRRLASYPRLSGDFLIDEIQQLSITITLVSIFVILWRNLMSDLAITSQCLDEWWKEVFIKIPLMTVLIAPPFFFESSPAIRCFYLSVIAEQCSPNLTRVAHGFVILVTSSIILIQQDLASV